MCDANCARVYVFDVDYSPEVFWLGLVMTVDCRPLFAITSDGRLETDANAISHIRFFERDSKWCLVAESRVG